MYFAFIYISMYTYNTYSYKILHPSYLAYIYIYIYIYI